MFSLLKICCDLNDKSTNLFFLFVLCMSNTYDSRKKAKLRKYFFSQLGFIQYIENIVFASRMTFF